MSPIFTNHVSSDRLGEAARHASLDGLRAAEREHVQRCDRCKRLYAGYRLADRLLAADWQQATLPTGATAKESLRTGPLGGVYRWRLTALPLAPIALALCLAALVGFGLLLPLLASTPNPAASPSHTASPQTVASASSSAGEDAATALPASPAAQSSPGSGAVRTPAVSGPSQGHPVVVPTPNSTAPIVLAGLPGSPVSWAPDGGHLIVARGSGWTTQRQIEIVDPFGHTTGSFTADSATWMDSSTIATATSSKSPGGPITVRLVNLNGNTTATLPGQYAGSGGGTGGAVLLGSGTGLVAIATHGGWGPADSTFIVWNGHSVGPTHQGVPIAFSGDGTRLAVLHPSGGARGGSSGWLEVVSVPGLQTIASYPHTTVQGSISVSGPGYAPDVAFSPDGRWLYDSGTLIDLTSGSATQVGEGGWLPDGTLLTSEGGRVLRWQGTHSVADARLPADGTVVTSRRGDVIEFFGDARPAVLLTASGTLRELDLPGLASIDGAQMAPGGSAVAISGHGANGALVNALARLN